MQIHIFLTHTSFSVVGKMIVKYGCQMQVYADCICSQFIRH